MRIKNTLLLILICFIGVAKVNAQELNLDVRINHPNLKLADPKVFRTLETTIKEFMNNTSWTDDEFNDAEKIEGSLQINITNDLSTNTFVADFYVTTSRPVFGSNYYSTLINHIGKASTFSYEEFAPIYSNKTTFSDNLSAILTYYAYMIIGFDYDSFSVYGGDKYFQIANNIVTSIPPNISNNDKAWVPIDKQRNKRNRYWFIENILNPRVRPYRRAFYEYHRQGLDVMNNDPEKAKLVMLAALKTIGDVNKSYPDSMIMQVFNDSKKQEIMDIFVPADRGDRLKVYDIMTKISPAQMNEFSDLR